jgi:hypothetical protein
MRKINLQLLTFAVATILLGCASPAIVGSKPSDQRPQLIKMNQQGHEFLTWDNQFLFGPVPSSLQSAGDIACMRARVDLYAAGYHPKARDSSGNELKGGGYYCYPKKSGDTPTSPPPRLMQIDGIYGWNNPAAFGKVPADLKARGLLVCERFGKENEAIAYHPNALAENGQPILGGGFLCAQILK